MKGLMGQDNGKDGFDEMKDNRTDNIVEYAYNMDNGYVEVWFTDGNMLRIKCEEVEAALRTTEQSLAKLHRLLDNKPISFDNTMSIEEIKNTREKIVILEKLFAVLIFKYGIK